MLRIVKPFKQKVYKNPEVIKQNGFTILQEEVTHLIGDSIIKYSIDYFEVGNNNKRKFRRRQNEETTRIEKRKKNVEGIQKIFETRLERSKRRKQISFPNLFYLKID